MLVRPVGTYGQKLKQTSMQARNELSLCFKQNISINLLVGKKIKIHEIMVSRCTLLLPCTCLYPARACATRGKVISRGGVHKEKIYSFLEPIFYLSKYSLSELYFNTDRLLIEFNCLWYSLAARQVFVAIANPDSLSFG